MLAPDLHSIVFTVLAVLQVQVDEPQGDGVTFVCAPAPVITGMWRVSVRVPWRLHLSQQRRGGRVGEQEQQETEVKMGGGWEGGKKVLL